MSRHVLAVTRIRCCTTLALLSLSLATSAAAAEPRSWSLHVRGLSSDYEHQFVSSYLDTTRFTVKDGRGFEVAGEIRPWQHVGLELSIGQLDFDGHLRVTQNRPISFDPLVFEEVTIFTSSGHFRMQPLNVGLLVHPVTTPRLDFYIGPQVTWTRYEVSVEGAQKRDPELGYGGKIGAEYVLGHSPWTVGLEYRHLQFLHETTDRDLYGSLGLNVGAITIGYRK
jgi:opacity protein-like surface antigen